MDQLSQVLFPHIVNKRKRNAPLECRVHFPAVSLICFFKISRHLYAAYTITERHGNIFNRCTLLLIYLFYYRVCFGCKRLRLMPVMLQRYFKNFLRNLFGLGREKILLVYGRFNREKTNQVKLETFIAALLLEFADKRFAPVKKHVVDVDGHPVAKERMPALGVNNFAL